MRIFPTKLSLLALAYLVAGACKASVTELPTRISPDHPLLLFSGRRDDTKPGRIRLSHSGGRARMAFEGDALGLWIDSTNPNWLNIIIDDKRIEKLKVQGTGGYYPLASQLGPGIHTVEVVKATESMVGAVAFKGFALPAGGGVVEWPGSKAKTLQMEFIGDSITCGYGIEVTDPHQHFLPETENFSDSYAGIVARNLKADYLVVARSGIGMLRNYGGPRDGSGDNLAAIYDQIHTHEATPLWDSQRFTPDVVCINLGTNDFSPPGVNEKKFETDYMAFLKKLIIRYPHAKFVVLMGPMLNSVKLKTILEEIVKNTNQEHPGIASFFELSPQGAHGFGADHHPSRAQARVNGEELTAYLEKMLRSENR